MEIADLLDFIRKIPIFSIYDEDELRGLIDHAELKSVGTGEVIFEHGDPGDLHVLAPEEVGRCAGSRQL